MASSTDTPIPVLSYLDRISARPGETVQLHVSSTQPRCRVSLVRIVSADPNPEGPGLIEEPMDDALPPWELSAHFRPLRAGSYAVSEADIALPRTGRLLFEAAVFPTALGGPRAILSLGEAGLALTSDGRAMCRWGAALVASRQPIRLRQWVWLRGGVDLSGGALFVEIWSGGRVIDTARSALAAPNVAPGSAKAVIAGRNAGGDVVDGFDGKIEAPRLRVAAEDGGEELLAAWDFSRGVSTCRVDDVGPGGRHARLVNYPTRAVTGMRWTGREHCWRHAPDQYAAIHFHADDLCAADWPADAAVVLPTDLPSGAYALRLETSDGVDRAPFFVRPAAGARTADIALLIPTFTYVVYGNHARIDYRPQWRARIDAWGAYPHHAAEHPELGVSTYNFHADGSGVCHASHLRPLLTLRPGYLTFAEGEGSGLRHFQADTHLIAWLRAKDLACDVITDHDLDDDGVAAIRDYPVVLTASHPEYHTARTLDALQAYRDSGGNFCYLGGNGFYWKIARHPEEPAVIEIRRAEGGIRAWAAEPGEYFHAFDGEYGGLWRRSGRPPQQLCGVGFSAQGPFVGSHYRRATCDPTVDWIFEGVQGDVIGDFGLSGGGAAGYELDRMDLRLGGPEETIVLARSEGHDAQFVLVPEEYLNHVSTVSGEAPRDLIRADMIYAQTDGGGALFSVGSITFCGALPVNNFQNPVSRLLENVVRGMLGRRAQSTREQSPAPRGNDGSISDPV